LLDLAVSYGLTDRIELSLDIPITIVDVATRAFFLASPSDPTKPVSTGSAKEIADGLDSNAFVISQYPFEAPGVEESLGVPIRDGTKVGVGQIGIDVKFAWLSFPGMELSPSVELLLQSPSEDQLSGPDSVGLFPRLAATYRPLDDLGVYLDVGYAYEIEFQELTGFAWNGGLSWAPLSSLAIDAGAGGYLFAKGVEVLPSQIDSSGPSSPTAYSLGFTRLGTNFVNALFGVKLRIVEGLVIAGAAVVPVTADGIRPDAAGSLAIEVHL
jgi:hypothetical protein